MSKIRIAALAAVLTFLATSCNNSNTGEPTATGPAAKPAAASGEEIYKKTCIACHQANGEGMPSSFPPLAKSDYLADKEKTILQVLKGSSGEITVNGVKYNNTMPPQSLSDEEIATVLTYVYGSFGNSGGTVTPADVKALRAKG
jgi:nitrite reductase (NO-forming)